MTKTPIADVSIIVPNFNNGRYLSAFINSVLNSTFHPLELIVIDDGSMDDSIKILENFRHISFLKPIHFEKNKGLTAALNAGLDICSGKYVMRADPDDRLSPQRIEKQFLYMETHHEIDVLGCNTIYFNGVTGKEINRSNFPERHENIVKAFKRGDHGIQHPTAFVKGEVYRKYRYQEIFPGEDYELFSRMVRDGYRFGNIREPLYYMRVHAESATSNLKPEHIYTTFKFRDQVFGTKTPKWKIWFYYQYMLNYRKFQRSDHALAKAWHLSLAALCHPSKVINRLANL